MNLFAHRKFQCSRITLILILFSLRCQYPVSDAIPEYSLLGLLSSTNITKSYVYMTDAGNGLLYRFDDLTGANEVTYDGSAGTAFGTPQGVALDSQGRIYVAANTRIYRFDDMLGSNQVEYNAGALGNPFNQAKAVHVDSNGHIFALDNQAAGRLYRFDDMSGTNQMELTSTWNNPQGITTDSAGHIYIASTFNNLVYRYDDISGAGEVTYNGNVGTNFNRPFNVAVDSGGRIYVTCLNNGLLYRFDDMVGSNQTEYNGSAGTTFANPRGMHVDANDRILVTDITTGLLYRFDDMSGTNQTEYNGSNGTAFNQPLYIDTN